MTQVHSKPEGKQHLVQLVINTPEPICPDCVMYEVTELLCDAMEQHECSWKIGKTAAFLTLVEGQWD